MKNFIMLLFLMGTNLGTANAQNKTVGKIVECTSIFGQRVKSGIILLVDFDDLGERTNYIYKQGNQLFLLTNDQASVSKMIEEELKLSKNPKSYLLENLLLFMDYFLFPTKSTVLDNKFIKMRGITMNYLENQPESLIVEKRELEIISEKFIPNNLISISDKDWKIVQFVGLNNGSVMKYFLEGNMQPFKITKFDSVEVATGSKFKCFEQF